jgi:hypothetical protein
MSDFTHLAFADGQLRWNGETVGTEGHARIWHLSWDGLSALCGARLGEANTNHFLDNRPPATACDRCKSAIREHLGL